MPTESPNRGVLFCGLNSYLDDSNGEAVASRSMMELLLRGGFATESLTGAMMDARPDVDPVSWLVGCGLISHRDGEVGDNSSTDDVEIIVDQLMFRDVSVACR